MGWTLGPVALRFYDPLHTDPIVLHERCLPASAMASMCVAGPGFPVMVPVLDADHCPAIPTPAG